MQSPVNPPIGEIDIVRPANPAAGTDFAYLTPNGYLYQLKSCNFTLTTAVAAANRNVNILTQIAAAPYWRAGCRNWQAASLVINYSFFPGAFDFLGAASLLQVSSIPTKHIMTANTQIISLIVNLQAADQISDISLEFEKWVLQTV